MQGIVPIIEALHRVRIGSRMNEDQIHLQIMRVFDAFQIRYKHEYQMIPRKRFDFWIDGIVVEVKKEKPSKITLLNQLNRYTKIEDVLAIVVVLEKSMVLPKSLNGKPIFVISLNINWGIAF